MAMKRLLEGDIEELSKAIRNSRNSNECRRVQCVYLGVLFPSMTAQEIGEITLYSKSQVWAIHGKYKKEGLEGLIDSRGGRYRENMTIDEESKFLEPFVEKSKTGTLVVAGEIKKSYEAKIGKDVAESTIYRLLDRHGFRKIVPYKRHMKANKDEQDAFKKTSSQL